MKLLKIRENPQLAESAAQFFAEKFGIAAELYRESMEITVRGELKTPQWYVALDDNDAIVGGCGLIDNDFIVRKDLTPYVCAVFVEPHARGQALGGRLLDFAAEDAKLLGYNELFLCTEHTSYYERYGWTFFGMEMCDDDYETRIYTKKL